MLKKVCQIFFWGGDVWIFWDTQNDLPLVIFFQCLVADIDSLNDEYFILCFIFQPQ